MNSRLSIELGMPHLGRTNLSESALLKVIGNDRWRQMQELGNIASALIQDEEGARLYATFFFFELNLPCERPLSAYGENHIIEFIGDISHHGRVYLDGRHLLSGDELSWIRSSNVFIYQERGPAKLSISSPANLDFSRIPELPAPPDSLDLCRRAKAQGSFFGPEADDVPLFVGKREFIYEIDADRDVNGAGLLYFANYICFLEMAERRILSSLPYPVPSSVLDERSTYKRRIGYYGNAQATDRLKIELSASLRILERGLGNPLLDFWFNYQVCRLSDGKEIAISSCRKVSPLTAGSEGQQWVDRLIRREFPGSGGEAPTV
jgi:probable biosynthetic protein (TIGR04098 family)